MKEPWKELEDPKLAAYFQALAEEEIPEPDPQRWEQMRREYRALVRALRPGQPWWARLWAWFTPPAQPMVLRWAVATVLLFVLLWGSGTALVNAAQDALPGSALYPVKQLHERWQLALARDPQQRARLHQTFAHRRVNELTTLLAQGRQEEAVALLANLLDHVDALARLAQEGPPPTLLAELAPLAVLTEAPDYRQQLLQRLNQLTRGQRLVGILEQRQGNTWTVSGRTVVLTDQTLIQGIPREGDVLEIVGRPTEQGWQAQWVRVAARAHEAPLPSIFVTGRLERQGEGWTIDGQPFVPADPAQAASWQPGQMVEALLRWNPETGQWEAEFLRAEAAFRTRERKVTGVLEALEPDRVRIAGQWWPLADHADIEGPVQPGMWVEAELWQNIEGEWLVVELEVEDEIEDDEQEEEEDEDLEEYQDDAYEDDAPMPSLQMTSVFPGTPMAPHDVDVPAEGPAHQDVDSSPAFLEPEAPEDDDHGPDVEDD